MKIINTRLHGILDYLVAFVLILPWIVDHHSTAEDTWALASLGGLIFLYSFITDYEFGLIKLIPMRVHFVFDIIAALLLVTSPWLFQFEHYTRWPAVVGLLYLVTIFLSSALPYRVTRRDLDITKPS
ncbi:MAG: hypothetical protein K0S12_804 [Bacteroidetes bacterium]|jgi:hypothetical protein|nr:hypothetical protein [Bacteroidota bacterium]